MSEKSKAKKPRALRRAKQPMDSEAKLHWLFISEHYGTDNPTQLKLRLIWDGIVRLLSVAAANDPTKRKIVVASNNDFKAVELEEQRRGRIKTPLA